MEVHPAQPGLVEALQAALSPQQVQPDLLTRLARAGDASFYELVPQVVCQPSTIDEVQRVFEVSHRLGVPMTFRTAGTSLSGQAITDGILVDVARHWRGMLVEDEGRRVRVQPGVVGGLVNRRLAPWGWRLGPDPASIDACMMGGILSNNSSGMCCGTEQNAYKTLESMVFLTPAGVRVDTADPAADAHLAAVAPELVRGLQALRERVLASPSLVARIRRKHRQKNTVGYNLEAFLDHATPARLLAQLMIGGEGTLGFIAEAVLRTVPLPRYTHTVLLCFPDIERACEAVAPLSASGAAAQELMDAASLRAVASQPGVPDVLGHLPGEAAALLVEWQSLDEASHAAAVERARCVLEALPLGTPPQVAATAAEQAALWKVRKGLLTSVGAARPSGTSVLIEDVTFPHEHLAAGTLALQELFARHGYTEGIIFGHARDANLHFAITQAFGTAADVARYEAFTRDLVELVVHRLDGALKAEHGTGRNMAPFVEVEWGSEAYQIMRDLKALLDPRGLLNPHVIISDDPRIHLTSLKALPSVDPEVDACMACGFCERHCPSRDLTLTPRQRIALRRHLSQAELVEALPAVERADLLQSWWHAGVETCATDGLCATACPVGIDTGQLVKRLRAAALPAWSHEVALQAVRHLDTLEQLVATGVALGARLQHLVGASLLEGLSRPLTQPLGLPRWRPELSPPRGAESCSPRVRRQAGRPRLDQAGAVLFTSCPSRMLGEGGDAFLELAERAGQLLWLPPDLAGLCCGMAFASKGHPAASSEAARRLVARMWRWSDGGRRLLVVDGSSCLATLRHLPPEALPPPWQERLRTLRVLDGAEYLHEVVLPRLPALVPLQEPVALHIPCGAIKAGAARSLEAIVRRAAHTVVLPDEGGCCGMAGDRGLYHPALVEVATAAAAAEVRQRGCVLGVSTNITCQRAMGRVTGVPYLSAADLLVRALPPQSGSDPT